MNAKRHFDIAKEPDKISIVCNSTMDNIDKIYEETRSFLKENNLNSEIFSVCLVMREGLTNAVRHGNKYDLQTGAFKE